MNRLIIVMASVVLSIAQAHAQTGADDPRRPQKPLVIGVGAMLGANINFHSAALSSYSSGENGVDCAGFGSARSVTPAFGIVANVPLTARYALHATLSYDVKSVRFNSANTATFARRDGSSVDVSHALDVSLSYLTLETVAVMSVPGYTSVKLGLGPAVSTRIASNIDQKIIETDDVSAQEFSVPLDARPQFSALRLSAVGRIVYSIELAKEVTVDAGLQYELPLTSVTGSRRERWSIASLTPRIEVRLPL